MFDNTKDKLFVISAPSAGGKTTIIKRLITLLNGSLHRVITCTTREMRDGELHDVDYKFLSKAEYTKLLEGNAFIEHANVYGNSYGVLSSDLQGPGNKIISLDSKGVENFKKINIAATYILIIPPSLDILRDRLLNRKTDSEEDITIRLTEAKKELEQADVFDHVIINDRLEEAIEACKMIITGEIEQ